AGHRFAVLRYGYPLRAVLRLHYRDDLNRVIAHGEVAAATGGDDALPFALGGKAPVALEIDLAVGARAGRSGVRDGIAEADVARRIEVFRQVGDRVAAVGADENLRRLQ